jgi:hypothetical protein
MQNNYSISNTNNIINHNTLLVKNGIKNNPKTTASNSRAHTTNKQQPTPPSKPPPPTLPKPKFILPPQTSATNLLLQRNLKSKSELNIAASNASVTTTTTANTVSSSGNTMNSNSSSSPSSSTSSTCSSSSTSKPCQKEMLMTTTNQKQTIENGMPLNFPQPPLRNKILENSSLVSSSQGYHSDTWESSHSSRQSFDIDSQPPTSTSSFVNTNNTQFNLNRFKQFNKISSKLASESKIAKTTSLNQQNESSSSHSCSSSSSSSSANAIGSSSSDGSINGGIASGSDDTDSSLPPSQKVFSKTPTKAATNSTPNMNCGIELPIYYQTSAKTFNSNNEEVISNYSTLLKSGQTNDEIVTATNNNNSSYSELYEIY